MTGWETGPKPMPVREALRWWWLSVVCWFYGHDLNDGQHIHGFPDYRNCWRCGCEWTRDGCAARGCQP